MQSSFPAPEGAATGHSDDELADDRGARGGAPPVAEGHQPESRPPGWLAPLGIIGIIYAVLGMLATLIGLAAHFAMPPYMAWLAEATGGAPVDEATLARVDDAVRAVAWTLVPLALCGVALGVVLFVGSLRLARHRRTARRPLMIWAVGRLVLAALAMANVFLVADHSVTITTAIPVAGVTTDPQVAWLQTVVGAFVSLLLTGLAPLAMLIALRNAKFRATIDALPEP